MRSVIGIPSTGAASIPSHSPPLPPTSFVFDPELPLLGKLRARASTIQAAAPPRTPAPPTAQSGQLQSANVEEPGQALQLASVPGQSMLGAWSARAFVSLETMVFQALGTGNAVAGGWGCPAWHGRLLERLLRPAGTCLEVCLECTS